MSKLVIPTPLRKFTNNQKEISIETSQTAGEALEELVQQYPDLKGHIFDENGELRRFVKIYLEEDELSSLQGKETPIKEGQTLNIIPAIAGGVSC